MGFAVTEVCEKVRQGNSDLHEKKRVWGNFENPNKTRPVNRRQPLKTRLEKPTYAYKIASGRPLYRYYDATTGRWPSRDPIGDVGGPTWFEKFEDYVKLRESYKDEEREVIFVANSLGVSDKEKLAIQDYYNNHQQLLLRILFAPSESYGSVNLYGMVSNDTINKFDILGLIRYGLFNTGHGRNAFENRSWQGAGAGNSRGFGTGADFLNTVSGLRDITRLDVHAHGYNAGVIGNGNDNGFYQNGTSNEADARHIQDFIDAVRNGQIDLERNAEINFFNCNSDDLAQELSRALGQIGRGDVSVTGASGRVSPDHRTPMANRFERSGARVLDGGNFQTYRNGAAVGNPFNTRTYR
ncbi:MAG: hypothetical protein P8O22_12265 [Akkermansiaceae bacterium]|nr:hypothetical protein [Akkermansiaceae bacterium]